MLILVRDAASDEAGFGLLALPSGLQNKNPLQKRSEYISLTFYVAGFWLSLSVGLVVVVWRSRLAGWSADGL